MTKVWNARTRGNGIPLPEFRVRWIKAADFQSERGRGDSRDTAVGTAQLTRELRAQLEV